MRFCGRYCMFSQSFRVLFNKEKETGPRAIPYFRAPLIMSRKLVKLVDARPPLYTYTPVAKCVESGGQWMIRAVSSRGRRRHSGGESYPQGASLFWGGRKRKKIGPWALGPDLLPRFPCRGRTQCGPWRPASGGSATRHPSHPSRPAPMPRSSVSVRRQRAPLQPRSARARPLELLLKAARRRMPWRR
jgi:hypothetical protein